MSAIVGKPSKSLLDFIVKKNRTERSLSKDRCILLNEGYEFFTKAVVRRYSVKNIF